MLPADVTLPMYPFPGGATPTAALGKALAQALDRRGLPSRWQSPRIPNHKALEALWLSSELALSQTCGLPLVETLAAKVRPLGTFLWTGVHSSIGRYRSFIVVRKNAPGRQRLRPAINGFHSLSGWASLGVYVARQGLAVTPPVLTGSHRRSLEAISEGVADIAAIDAVTWSLAYRTSPEMLRNCQVISEGPELPGLPLITRTEGTPVTTLQSAIFEALDHSDGRQAARILGIGGFVVQGIEDFDTVPALAREATTALPRPRSFRRYP